MSSIDPTTSDTPQDNRPLLTFRRSHRLTHAREFQRVYDAKCRKTRGSIMVYAVPNTLAHARLGLSVGSRVGPAVVRNRAKRLIREAFRISQHELARGADGHGYDIVVAVRGGETRPGDSTRARAERAVPPLAGLIATLRDLVAQCDVEWRRRGRREGDGA